MDLVEQLAENGPLEGRRWVEDVEAGDERVVALLHHLFQHYHRGGIH